MNSKAIALLDPIHAGVVNDMARNIHKIAIEKRWWIPGQDRSDLELLMLAVSELGEACEALRIGNPESQKIQGYSLAEEEIADCIIRLLDTCVARGWNIGGALIAKIEYNKTRPERHGGKLY